MNAYLDDQNAFAYQYQKAVSNQFQSICEPLFKLGIKYFAYSKIYKDGHYLRLTNNLEYSKRYLSEIKNNGPFFTKKLNSTQMDKNSYVLLNDIRKFDKNNDPIQYLNYDFNMWNSFHIYSLNNKGFFEGYCFMMSRDETIFSEFYLDNINLLERFAKYFNEKAQHLINCQDKSKLAHYEQQFNFYRTSQEDLFLQKAEQFLRETRLSRLSIQGIKQKIILSKRETECLRYLVLGKSAKEIAKDLSLSPRTIESYLKNIKNKTGYTKETQIVAAFSKIF